MSKSKRSNADKAGHSRLVRKWDGTDVPDSDVAVMEVARPTLRTLRARLSDNPNDPAVRVELAQMLLSRGKHREVIGMLDAEPSPLRGPQTGEHYWPAVHAMALALAEEEEWDRARQLADEGAIACPDTLDFYYLLAYIGHRTEDYALAQSASRRYLSLRTEAVKNTSTGPYDETVNRVYEVHNYLGVAQEKGGDLDGAMESYENAIQAKPSYDTAWHNLIHVLELAGRNEDAAAIARKAREACPRSKFFKRRERQPKTQAPELKTPTISLCMIVKNEEEHLPQCLKSARPLVDQIVVLDTGSTDRTVEIAKSFGAEVHFHAWEGNFSKARNISMGHASGDWILILDADEELDPADFEVIRRTLRQTDFKAIGVSVYNYSAQKRMYTSFLPSVRLFRRDLGAFYEGIVHNQLRFPSIEGVLRVPVRVYHYGYGLSPEVMARKIARTKGLLQEQLRQNPKNAFAHFNMAQLLRGEEGIPTPESMDRVIYHAGRAVDLTNPESPQERHIHLMALHQLVTAYFNKGDYTRAAENAHRALSHKPGYLDAILSLGHVHSMDGQFNLARKYYLEYLDRQKNFDEHAEVDHVILLHLRSRHNALYGLGLVAEMQGDPGESIKWYDRCIAERDDYLDVHYRLGLAHLKQGRTAKARECFELQLKHHSEHVEARIELAALLTADGEPADAIRGLEEGLNHVPDSHRLRFEIAQRRFAQGDHESVIGQLAGIPEDNEFAVAGRRMRADALFAQGRYEEAAHGYEVCLNDFPDDAGLMNNLGNCRYRLGDYTGAVELYRRVIDQGAPDKLVYRNLGLSLARLDQLDDAIFALESYGELEPNDVESAGFLGDLFYNRRDYGRAIAEYERVIERQPNRPDTLTRLGDCYLNRGAVAAALLGYERALVADPEYRPAWDRVREIREYLVSRIRRGDTDGPPKPMTPRSTTK